MNNLTTNAAASTLHSSYAKCSIQPPAPSQIDALRQLWKHTFGDSDAFLDLFYETAFSFDRCFCVSINDTVAAALYWFNCEFLHQKIAYIYAVATAKEFRGQGICHALMEHTHLHLKGSGYAGAILSPAEDSLFDFYKNMGYEISTYIKEIRYENSKSLETNDMVLKSASHDTLRKITKKEFMKLRRSFLPKTAIFQENENLDFLEQQACFYAGNDFLLTAQIIDVAESDADTPSKHLHGIEFLGNPVFIPVILHMFSCTSGTFRTIGMEKPFGMYYAFTESNQKPSYLGFAFD